MLPRVLGLSIACGPLFVTTYLRPFTVYFRLVVACQPVRGVAVCHLGGRRLSCPEARSFVVHLPSGYWHLIHSPFSLFPLSRIMLTCLSRLYDPFNYPLSSTITYYIVPHPKLPPSRFIYIADRLYCRSFRGKI